MAGSKKYRKLQGELDKIGIFTFIIRSGKRQFDFVVNGEIVKSFKKRSSANMRIVKLHKEHYATV